MAASFKWRVQHIDGSGPVCIIPKSECKKKTDVVGYMLDKHISKGKLWKDVEDKQIEEGWCRRHRNDCVVTQDNSKATRKSGATIQGWFPVWIIRSTICYDKDEMRKTKLEIDDALRYIRNQ